MLIRKNVCPVKLDVAHFDELWDDFTNDLLQALIKFVAEHNLGVDTAGRLCCSVYFHFVFSRTTVLRQNNDDCSSYSNFWLHTYQNDILRSPFLSERFFEQHGAVVSGVIFAQVVT